MWIADSGGEHPVDAPLTHPLPPRYGLSRHASRCHRLDLLGLPPCCGRSALELALALSLRNPFALAFKHDLTLELSH